MIRRGAPRPGPGHARTLAPTLAGLLALAACAPIELPDVHLQLSKNCSEVEVITLAAAVGTGEGERALDVAADTGASGRAWLLVRRPGAGEDDELVVQRVSRAGVEYELLLPLPGVVSPGLSLRPDPSPGRVWVIRDEPGLYSLFRIDPEDPARPLLASDDLSAFPDDGTLCQPCDTSDWPRELVFLPSGPALVSVPPFSVDAGLIVWVTLLSTETAQIRYGAGNRLNFEPPCEDDSPEGQAFCEMQRMNLLYPKITVLGVQQEPRFDQTTLFGHRTRAQSYDGQDFPIESADVFMITISLTSTGVPEGVLRSYSGFYAGPANSEYSPTPTADPPFGMAVDRFASYGLFSNGGVLPRLVQLPTANPDFVELTERVSLDLDTRIIQLDRDLALARLDEGQWIIDKLFPDDPAQSSEQIYQTDAPITEVVSGGIGTFMLRKGDDPPEIVRVQCPESDYDDG